jgi:GH25 family lysozyme M1 (1,4-beta-N-acetylmuramidase)
MARSIAWLLLALLLPACRSGDGEDTRQPAPFEAVASSAEAIQECPGPAVEGVDVFDGQGAIDWAAAADAGVAFAWIKATQGTYDTQSTFAGNWAGAARAGVRRGAYHFFDPTEDGAAQARAFLAVLATGGPLAAGDMPPMLDAECPDGDADCLGTGASGAATAGSIAGRMWDWIHTVENTTGRPPVLYTFASYFASAGVDAGGLEAYPLFLAYPTTASCFGVPAPWSRATLWQYSWTGSVRGIPAAVDRDRFLGSLADLALFAGAAGASSAADGGAAGCH